MTNFETYDFIKKEKGFIKSEYDCGTNEISIEANGLVTIYMIGDILETLGSKLGKNPMTIAKDALRIKREMVSVKNTIEQWI